MRSVKEEGYEIELSEIVNRLNEESWVLTKPALLLLFMSQM